MNYIYIVKLCYIINNSFLNTFIIENWITQIKNPTILICNNEARHFGHRVKVVVKSNSLLWTRDFRKYMV